MKTSHLYSTGIAAAGLLSIVVLWQLQTVPATGNSPATSQSVTAAPTAESLEPQTTTAPASAAKQETQAAPRSEPQAPEPPSFRSEERDELISKAASLELPKTEAARKEMVMQTATRVIAEFERNEPTEHSRIFQNLLEGHLKAGILAAGVIDPNTLNVECRGTYCKVAYAYQGEINREIMRKFGTIEALRENGYRTEYFGFEGNPREQTTTFFNYIPVAPIDPMTNKPLRRSTGS